MNRIAYILIPLLFSAGQISTVARPTTDQLTESSSFETGFDGWSIKNTDVWGDPPEAWSITRSQDMATDGTTSVKFFLANFNDAEKLWIERPFSVAPGQIFDVKVEYTIAAVNPIDGGPLFTIMTGVLKRSPNTREDLAPSYKDEAHNGSSESGYKWLDKQYEFTVKANEEGVLYVVIGIWGTWEVSKIFYVDNVQVTISKKPETSQFYSFEDDPQEWTSKNADLDSGSGTIERIKQFALNGEDGNYSIKFDLNSLNGNGKVWIQRPFLVERGRKYKVALDYAFHSNDCGDTPRFRIISGVFRRPPETGDDLLDAVQEKTTSIGCTWGWLHKSYQFTIKAKKTDALYLVIGIWGTEMAHRTYNVDSVCVTVTPK